MKFFFLITLLLISTTLLAYVDSDFDGVEDSADRCPSTPFMELVDINGCTTKSLVSPHSLDIIVGVSYSDSDYQTLTKTDTLSSSIQVDYYYKKFSFQVSTSYFTTKGNGYEIRGLYDSFLGASYQFEATNKLSVRFGFGALLPTYKTSLNNNNTDYLGSLNFSYSMKKFSLFGGYSYSLINDDDITILYGNNLSQDIQYQNTSAFSLGIGYYLSDDIYINSSYNSSSSVYTTYTDIQTASVYTYYSFDDHWFGTASYAKGISDSASKNYLSLRLGYLF